MRRALLTLAPIIAIAVIVLTWNSSTDTSEAATDGAAMSMSVSPAITCPGAKDPGDVCVAAGSAFTVTVNADAIPLPAGYDGAQAFIQYGATGLTYKSAALGDWALDPMPPFGATFLCADNGTGVVCGALVLRPPGSTFFKGGSLFVFNFNCTPGKSQGHVLDLETLGGPNAGTSGSAYAEFGVGNIAATGNTINLNCTNPITPPPKLAWPGDTDGDGCPDVNENLTKAEVTQGGGRDYLDPYDYYDVNGDGVIDLLNDILGVIQHYQPIPGGAPPYAAAFDRGPTTGPNAWNMTAPDGVIDLLNDILGVILQFDPDGCTDPGP